MVQMVMMRCRSPLESSPSKSPVRVFSCETWGWGWGEEQRCYDCAKTAVNTSIYGNLTERELGKKTGLVCFLVLEYII